MYRRAIFGCFERHAVGELRRIIRAAPVVRSEGRRRALISVANNYAANKFDLLGTGWTTSCERETGRGFSGTPPASTHEGPEGTNSYLRVSRASAAYADEVRRLVDPNYRWIDWQRDFKSGFRWVSETPSAFVRFGNIPGADIKVPWELSKLQHLPQLAIAAANCSERAEADRFLRAFRNQVLDFVATNPPGYGAAWCTAMCASIRIANILVAHDLFLSVGMATDAGFERVLYRTTQDHVRYVVDNLDVWVDRQRNNHFIANVAGLAVAGAFLPESTYSNDVCRLVLTAIESEARHQFNADGSSTEGSTAYHAFASEMMAWSVAFVQTLSSERLDRIINARGRTLSGLARSFLKCNPAPDRSTFLDFGNGNWLRDRIIASSAFLADCIDDSGRIVQVGDNDSGRFFKLCPVFEKLSAGEAVRRYESLTGYGLEQACDSYWDEDLLDYTSVTATLTAVTQPARITDTDAVEFQVVNSMRACSVPLETSFPPAHDDFQLEPPDARWDGFNPTIEFDNGALCISRLQPSAPVTCSAYADFGLYVFRSSDFLLYVRCGGMESLSTVGHPHDDQLSVALQVGGTWLIQDPGTFVYTADPAERQFYRSRSAHFVPGWSQWAGDSPADVFDGLTGTRSAQLLYADQNRFVGSLEVEGKVIVRTIHLSGSEIVLRDTEDGIPMDLATAFRNVSNIAPSVGYGKRLNVSTPVERMEPA